MSRIRTLIKACLRILIPVAFAGLVWTSAAVADDVRAGDGLTGHNAYDFTLQGGLLLIQGVSHLHESIPGWTLRGSLPTSRGIFELAAFSGRGHGESYYSAIFEYRLDIDLPDEMTANFAIGGHFDQYTPIDHSSQFGGGWQFGAGVSGALAGPLRLRGDFRYRFGPGTAVDVMIGFTFRTAFAGGQ